MKEQAKTPVFQEDNGTWAHLTKLVLSAPLNTAVVPGFHPGKKQKRAINVPWFLTTTSCPN